MPTAICVCILDFSYDKHGHTIHQNILYFLLFLPYSWTKTNMSVCEIKCTRFHLPSPSTVSAVQPCKCLYLSNGWSSERCIMEELIGTSYIFLYLSKLYCTSTGAEEMLAWHTHAHTQKSKWLQFHQTLKGKEWQCDLEIPCGSREEKQTKQSFISLNECACYDKVALISQLISTTSGLGHQILSDRKQRKVHKKMHCSISLFPHTHACVPLLKQLCTNTWTSCEATLCAGSAGFPLGTK